MRADDWWGIHVSLPRNDLALARRAVELGATGLKVHIGVHHRASGHSFGSLQEELTAISSILDVGVPVGLVVGAGERVNVDEIRRAARMPFEYFDLYSSEMPDDYVVASGPVTPMVALGPDDHADRALELAAQGIGAFELSTLDPALYGTPLAPATLDRIRSIRNAVDSPLVVPSQHRLVPEDVPILRKEGASAVLLGAVVLGTELRTMTEALPAFVEAIPGPVDDDGGTRKDT